MNFKKFSTSDNQWHDVPYYQHKTATDTLTLPAVIYPNDTSITVGIKGNTTQSGTPSPSNPVSVDGVGELETSGEHAGQFKIPILLNNQTINKYLGTEQTTRQIKKLVLTGQETWYSSNTYTGSMYAYHSQFPNILAESKIYCSHLPYSEKSEYQYGTCCSDENSISLWMFDTTTSSSAFKSYIASEYEAGHPVTIWYILATPQTDVVNEPLMKIGNYADSLNTSVPCTAGENTLDVQTTLQPSEVTAGFSGWHPVQSVHERENGQWD